MSLIRFQVTAEKPKINSMLDVMVAGKTPTNCPFSVIPLEHWDSSPYKTERGLVGEDLNRAIRLQSNGPTFVEVSTDWIGSHSTTWRDEIIDLALQQFATPPLRAL
jgi:hypothetical protein